MDYFKIAVLQILCYWNFKRRIKGKAKDEWYWADVALLERGVTFRFISIKKKIFPKLKVTHCHGDPFGNIECEHKYRVRDDIDGQHVLACIVNRVKACDCPGYNEPDKDVVKFHRPKPFNV